MTIFLAIAIGSFLLVAGSFLFGHDHDSDHGHDGHDHGSDHSLDSDAGEPTISVFSMKVLATLSMGFGAAGAIARLYGAGYLTASLIGVVCGLVLGGLMFLILRVFYLQQASSLVATNSAVGRTGTVTVSISEGGMGEVGVHVNDQYVTYSASAKDGRSISKGQSVRVVRTDGSRLIVEKEA